MLDEFDEEVLSILKQFNTGEDIIDNIDANNTPVSEQLDDAITQADGFVDEHKGLLKQLTDLREKRAIKNGNSKCSVCGNVQFETSSGLTCKNGHGGAPPAVAEAQPETVDLVHECKYVCYSDINETVFSAHEDFDVSDFEEQLGTMATWGNANRSMVCLRDFCDAIRAVDGTSYEEACEIVEKVGKIVPYDVYIDMEN
jgi:hypothetical protein